MTNELFTPFQINHKTKLQNRLVMAPMTINSSLEDGTVSDQEIDYYQARSSHLGMVITSGAYISPEGQAFANGISAARDSNIPSLHRLALAIKKEGAKAILQIYHGGRMARTNYNENQAILAPSPVKANRPWAHQPKALEEDDIEDLITNFGQASRRAIQAGFDGVELHGANTYLLQQFFSPHSNQRTDDWGNSLENRFEFSTRVIKEVQKTVQDMDKEDFLIGYRLSPEELEAPGIRIEDSLRFIDHLISAKIDYVHLSVRHYQQASFFVEDNQIEDLPQLIYQHIAGRVPLINVGKVRDGQDAQLALKSGDLVAVGRQLLIDPDWPQKIQDDQAHIAQAIHLNDQDKLAIPDPLWQMITDQSGWIPVVKGEESKKWN